MEEGLLFDWSLLDFRPSSSLQTSERAGKQASERIDWLECSGQRCAVIDASLVGGAVTAAIGAVWL